MSGQGMLRTGIKGGYTPEQAKAEADHVASLLGDGATVKTYDRDRRMGSGTLFIVANGCVSIKSSRPGRFTARFEGRMCGISTPCIDEDGTTAEEALKMLRATLEANARRIRDALEIIP